tara:strand:- start:1202 stop:2299 length:1098 start_codon:yes stop_codon:yes gene_type:complete
MNIKEFKNELKNIYVKYSEFVKAIDKYSDDYLKFLYMHLNENIKIELSENKRESSNNLLILESSKFKYNKKFSDSLIFIYKQFLNNNDKTVLLSGKDFYVNVYEENYDEKGTQEYFSQKNRRDFLIPSFFNKKTIEFINNLNIDESTNYHTNLKDFYLLLGNIRKNIATKNRLGTIIASSISLQSHNLRPSKDLDTVILHPKNDQENVIKNLKEMATKLDFMDPYIDKIFDEWDGIDKTNMYMVDQISHPNKQNFFDIIVNPDFHYYFFGIKLIDLDYDLKYRAIRRFPKNVADLILVKTKIKKEVPKIKALEELIVNETEWEGKPIVNRYSKFEFIDKVRKYLFRFGLNLDHGEVENEINNISY